MWIDFVWILLIIIGAIKGLRKGFILSAFSLLGFIIGLIAALKLSAFVAIKLQVSISVSSKWLPVISFMVVFLATAILIRFGGKILQKAIEGVALGWLNKIAGAAVYICLYTIIYSVVLFYLVNLNIISAGSIAESKLYVFIQPVGPVIIEKLSIIIPFLKDVFTQLENFFTTIGEKLEH